MNPLASQTFRRLGWPILALVLILLFDLIFIRHFGHVSVINGRLVGYPIDILSNGSRVMLLAAGMTLVIATGGVDLSVGAIMAIVAAVTVECDVAGYHTAVSLAAGIGAALLCGLWNGTLVALLDIQPIVATLVLMVAGRGIAQLITAGQIPNFTNPVLTFIGQGYWLFPFSIYLVAIVYLLIWLFTRRTGLGLMIEAVGDNGSAARRAGVPVTSVKFLAYAVSGLCAGVAGLVDAGLIRSADANNAGLYMELDAIFAVVVGGTALIGGRYYLAGSLIGAILLQTLVTTILAFNVPSHLIPLPKALTIILVVLLQSAQFRAWARSLFTRRQVKFA